MSLGTPPRHKAIQPQPAQPCGQHERLHQCLYLYHESIGLLLVILYDGTSTDESQNACTRRLHMRLLNTKTLKFKEFFDDVPKYTILSHRWCEEEISYERFLAQDRTARLGYQKIERLCEISRANQYEWAWIDTCCIDKRSSQELSEAINSMYAWYKRADVCLVFLPDVHAVSSELPIAPTTKEIIRDQVTRTIRCGSSNFSFDEAEFRDSDWFNRGWTLQEMLAPNRLIFFNTSYRPIGTRSMLADLVSDVTGIAPQFLNSSKDTNTKNNRSAAIDKSSFATKMYWASRRKTSRAEDRIYCLFGLLNLNMPLLYGEGEKEAFERLQKEFISRNSFDDSLYVWDRRLHRSKLPGLLAPSPSYFRNSRNVTVSRHILSARAFTNIGLEIDLHVPKILQSNSRKDCADVLFELSSRRISPYDGSTEPIFLPLLLWPPDKRSYNTAQANHMKQSLYVMPEATVKGQAHSAVDFFDEKASFAIRDKDSWSWVVSGSKCSVKPSMRRRLAFFSRKSVLYRGFWSDETVYVRIVIENISNR